MFLFGIDLVYGQVYCMHRVSESFDIPGLRQETGDAGLKIQVTCYAPAPSVGKVTRPLLEKLPPL